MVKEINSSDKNQDRIAGKIIAKNLSTVGEETPCPSFESLSALKEGHLEEPKTEALYHHFTHCDKCYQAWLFIAEATEREIRKKKAQRFFPSAAVAVIFLIAIPLYVSFQTYQNNVNPRPVEESWVGVDHEQSHRYTVKLTPEIKAVVESQMGNSMISNVSRLKLLIGKELKGIPLEEVETVTIRPTKIDVADWKYIDLIFHKTKLSIIIAR